jgi:DNA primase
MNLEGIKSLLSVLGCEKIKPGYTGWVNASCPLAPWYHKDGSDKKPSFAVHIKEGGVSAFTCFTCNNRGNLAKLLGLLKKRGVDVTRAQDIVKLERCVDEDKLLQEINDAKERPKALNVAGANISSKTLKKLGLEKEPEPLEERVLAEFTEPSLEALLYLLDDSADGRKLTPETVERWQTLWHGPKKQLVLPVRDCKGRLRGFSRRFLPRPYHIGWSPSEENEPPKYLHCKGFRRDFVLYGEHLFNLENRHAYMMEGFFDVQYVGQCGYENPFAIMGTYLSEFQRRKILRWFDAVTIVQDGDEAGREMTDRVSRELSSGVDLNVIEMPEGSDANGLLPGQLRHCLGDPKIVTKSVV